MTTLEISIPYRLWTKKTVFWVSVAWGALGIWLIVQAAALFAWVIAANSSLGGWIAAAKWLFFTLGGITYVYVPFQLAMIQTQGTKVVANQAGLSLPPSIRGLGLARWYQWQDLKTLALGSTLGGKPSSIKLQFRSGNRVQLNLNCMPIDEIDELLLAMEVWAPSCVWSSALMDYRDNLKNSDAGASGLSSTDAWEEELSRRFSSTSFLPLVPGSKLRSSTIEIKRQLAFGGFSAVYVATDSSSIDNHRKDRTVILKESVVPESSCKEVIDKAQEMFAREATLLSNLNHHQIAKVFDYFREDGRSYLVLEHIDGTNLRKVVEENGPQSIEKVKEWGLQLANILHYLHTQDPPILHRDLTPDNIVCTPDGTLVLIDFGAANEYMGSATGTLVGKQSYMSAEQVRGKAQPATDLYALGCTLFFLLTGEDPEPISVSRVTSRRPDVPSDLDCLIEQLTSMDPEKRPSAELTATILSNPSVACLEKLSLVTREKAL